MRPGTGSDVIEKDWSRHVLGIAKRGGWELRYHTHDSRHNSLGTVPGFPDWLFGHERKRLVVVAELKGDTGHGRAGASDEQDRWLLMFAMVAIPAYVWTPADEAEVVDVLLGQRARRDRDMLLQAAGWKLSRRAGQEPPGGARDR